MTQIKSEAHKDDEMETTQTNKKNKSEFIPKNYADDESDKPKETEQSKKAGKQKGSKSKKSKSKGKAKQIEEQNSSNDEKIYKHLKKKNIQTSEQSSI